MEHYYAHCINFRWDTPGKHFMQNLDTHKQIDYKYLKELIESGQVSTIRERCGILEQTTCRRSHCGIYNQVRTSLELDAN